MEASRNDNLRLDRNFSSYLRTRYSPIPKDETEKVIDGIVSILVLTKDRNQTLKNVLDAAARTIYRLFEFKEIAIGT